MKLYSASPHGVITMGSSEQLDGLLRRSIADFDITHVVESGTYLGLGSTTFVAKAFPADRPPKQFVTIEISWLNWRRAKANLAQYPFVRVLWGRTIPRDSALAFVENDDVLGHHERYDDVYIDDVVDPRAFYRNELNGRIAGMPQGLRSRVRWGVDRALSYSGDDVLTEYLTRYRDERPLILLDSAGGIGLLEFSVVQKVMGAAPYLLLLDDINHLKHFRSRQKIEADANYRVLGCDPAEGWLLAAHGMD